MKSFKLTYYRSLFLLSFLAVMPWLEAQQLAFPEAEGFGRYVTGGRQGSVYHVTNLNDSGRGSFRDAVSQSNRIVVFDVGGVINISSRIVISKNVTIAGQTAPGDGITIYGNGIALTSSSGNNIIQHIRIRMGKNGDSGKDAVGISGGSGYIFSHVSISWGRDGTLDVNGSGVDNLTFQDCIIGQGINNQNHSTGGLMQSGRWSVIRSLYIDNKTRNPKARGSHEFINSVLYNWGTNGFIMGDTGGDSYCNMMGNYFICGPSGSSSNYFTGSTPTYRVYGEDNWQDGNKDGVLNGSQLIAANGDYKTATVVATAYRHPGVQKLLSAQDALQYVMDSVGASLVRDNVDDFLIDELKSFGTKGRIINTEDDNGIRGAVGTLYNGPKPLDTDGDGMPDEWEDANGTQKDVDDAMTISDNGYVNIENYIHSITAPLPFLKHPINVRTSSPTKTTINLKWQSEEDQAEKIIVEYGNSENNFDQSVEVAGDATSTVIEGLESGTMYYFRLKSLSTTAESAFSEVVSGQTVFSAIPPVPSSNPVPANESSIRTLNDMWLAWENTTPELGGTMYYDVLFGTSPENMSSVASSITEDKVFVGDLTASTTYYWTVAATNDLGTTSGEVWSFTASDESLGKILYLPFDESDGDVAKNYNGAEDATAVGFTPAWTNGYRNNGLLFRSSASNYRMVVPYYPGLSLGRTSFTISLWFKSSGTQPDSYLFHKGTHSASGGGTGKWVGIQYKNSMLSFGVDDNSTKTTADISASQWFDNTWHHLACTRDISAKLLKVYIDGVMVGEVGDNTGSIAESADLILGNRNTNFDNPYVGTLDELAIYNEALSDNEIQYIYSSTPTDISDNTLKTTEVQIYPNPFVSQIAMNNVVVNTDYTIELYSITGNLMYSKQLKATEKDLVIDGLGEMPKGVYICKLVSTDHQYTAKLIKR